MNYSTAHTPKTDVIPTLQRIRSMQPYKLTKPLDRIQAQTLAGIYWASLTSTTNTTPNTTTSVRLIVYLCGGVGVSR